MEKFDVAIAGAGIAGSLLARNLARAGHSTVVFERDARDKLGHDWWDAVLTEVFAEVDLPEPKPPELMNSSGPITVYSPLESVRMSAPPMPDKIHVDRKPLAQRMIRLAEEAGAKIEFGASVVGPVVENSRAAGMIVRGADGAQREVRARLVIDSTGMNAALRSQLPPQDGFDQRVGREDTFITFREIRKRIGDDHEKVLFFGADYGVRWIDREQDGLIDFFAGTISAIGKENPKKAVEGLIARVKDAGPEAVRAGVGGLIPVRRSFDSFVAPGFLLCGDAACQCNPIDGSGIASSMRAAHHASRAAHEALENNSLDVASMWGYNAAYQRTMGSKFVALDAVQKFLVREKIPSIDLLFRRGVLKVETFWGTGGAKEEQTASRLLKLFKLLDRPAFMMRLVRSVSTAKKLAEHYTQYPERCDAAEFAEWRSEVQRLFARITRGK